MYFTEPLLVQACVINFIMSSIFTSFWTTLSFLLSSPPFNYSSLVIGLFALIGIAIICWGPVYSRLVIDKIQPLYSCLLGISIELTGVAIGTFIGTFTVAGPVLEAVVIDLGNQACNIANRTAINDINPKARNRVNVGRPPAPCVSTNPHRLWVSNAAFTWSLTTFADVLYGRCVHRTAQWHRHWKPTLCLGRVESERELQ